jgi:hypothetical protein
MTSGLSGAFVLKLIKGTSVDILKLSKEVSKLKIEHQNAKKKYSLFPPRFIVPIREDEFESNDKKVFSILIKEVSDSITLFDFIKTNNKDTIENILKNLFIGKYALEGHYKKNRNSSYNWNKIFEKLNIYKFILIENAYEELKPLLSEFENFNITEIKNLVIDGRHLSMDITKTTEKLIKESTLCHGDFHSKNVLVQGDQPVIIDTGHIDYYNWSIDICKLIVDLFISGINANSKEFYDINKISSNLETVQLIIDQKEIPLDGNNDNFIIAINWLIKHCSEIYEDLYTIYEYQLGLMKEFLQISFRVASIPPNKRAIALIAAYNCMGSANESLKIIPK